ncbi:MAG: hypothetical protein ACP5OO_11195 [Chloroflexia bacterium]
MSPSETVPLGMDPGYGYFKLALSVPQPRSVAFPALVAPGAGRFKARLLGTKPKSRTVEVETAGGRFLVGYGAQEQGHPLTISQALGRFQDAPELLPLFGASLASLGVGDPGVQAVLAVGLPVELLQTEETRRRTVAHLRSLFLGTHTFRVGRTSFCVEVRTLLPLPQPAGAFFAWGLAPDGRWVRPKEDLLEARVGICDIGFNTCDLFAVRAGEVLSRWTGGENIGLRKVLETLQALLYREHGLSLSLHELDVEGVLWKEEPVLRLPSGALPLRAERDAALSQAAGEVVAFLERTWAGARQFAYILITGGGSRVFQKALRQYFGSSAEFLPEPLVANAVGLARYAARRVR